MKTAIYPGSFDPVTLGHFDIIKRSSEIFDQVIVGVLCNNAKSPLFSVEERVKMLEEVTKDIPNVEVQSFDGLLVDFMRQNHAKVIVRGLRAITDFEYELQLAQMNRVIAPEIDTLFLTTNLKYAYLFPNFSIRSLQNEYRRNTRRFRKPGKASKEKSYEQN